eukprot:366297-Chlamydomonas_euryale.AAC.4
MRACTTAKALPAKAMTAKPRIQDTQGQACRQAGRQAGREAGCRQETGAGAYMYAELQVPLAPLLFLTAGKLERPAGLLHVCCLCSQPDDASQSEDV